MGGRFGKYGDAKRRQTLRKSRCEKHRLEGLRLRERVRRRKTPPQAAPRPQQTTGKPGSTSDSSSH